MTDATEGISTAEFLADVLSGFAGPQKSIPGKYLWDAEGSRIFQQISETSAYYQTAAEAALTVAALPEIAAIVGAGPCIVEFGSGASQKVRRLLDGLEAPSRYVALDISREYMEAAAARIAADYPSLEVRSVCADFSRPLPELPVDRRRPVLGFFPGTSIGNMSPPQAGGLLSQLRQTLQPGFLLIGQDPNRNATLLQGAYEGPLMTALHKNVLARLERELGAKLDFDAFRHESRTLADRVEPHLVARQATSIEIGNASFTLALGESIRTDVSYKYDLEAFASLVAGAGWSVARRWLDADRKFCLYLLDARG